MVQRIANFDKWERLEGEKGIFFSNPMARTVRVQVNASDDARLYVTPHGGPDEPMTGETFFLALVRGLDVVEFSPPGAFTLNADSEGEVFVFTADGADVSFTLDAPESFTKIVERRRRNPELEAVVAAMNRSIERRLSAQAGELEQLRRIAESAGTRAIQPETSGVPASAPPQPGQTHGQGSSVPQAAPAGGGGGEVKPTSAAPSGGGSGPTAPPGELRPGGEGPGVQSLPKVE